jgi:hypothetical protein
MKYRISLNEEAALAFAKLRPALRAHLSSELRRLAGDPTQASTPVHFPHPQDGQLFHAEPLEEESSEHYFTVMFKYSGEAVLVVEWILHVARPRA